LKRREYYIRQLFEISRKKYCYEEGRVKKGSRVPGVKVSRERKNETETLNVHIRGLPAGRQGFK